MRKLKKGEYVKVMNKEEQKKVLSCFDEKTISNGNSQNRIKSNCYPKFIDFDGKSIFIWECEKDAEPSTEVKYSDLLPTYEIGKEYEFSDYEDFSMYTRHELLSVLPRVFNTMYIANIGGGNFEDFKFIREIELENPRIKEIETQIEELKNELKTLK